MEPDHDHGHSVDDSAREALLTGIDPRQNEGRGKKLECAAEGKALVPAICDRRLFRGIEDRHPKAAAVSPFEIGNLQHHLSVSVLHAHTQQR